MLAVLVARVRAVMWSPVVRGQEAALRPRNESREMTASFLLSLLVHLAIACLFLVAAILDPDRPKIGSEELDIELVAPRLAPPPANNAARGARQTEGGRTMPRVDPRAAQSESKAVAARSKKAREQRLSKARAFINATEHASHKKAARAERVDSAKASAAKSAERLPERKRRRTAVEPQKSKRRPSAKAGLTESEVKTDEPARIGRLALMPNDIDPTRLLKAVKSEIVARSERRQRHRARLREREQRLAQRWSSFKSSTESVASASLAGFVALATRGSKLAGRNGAGTRGTGNARRSRSPQYGLKFYLSGRPLATSKVVRPPQLVSFSRRGCRIASPKVTPATVRALVTLEGHIDHAYIRHSSSNRRFDTCALKQVRGMRFRPGTDKQGRPLDVWIHVRVAPGLPTTAL